MNVDHVSLKACCFFFRGLISDLCGTFLLRHGGQFFFLHANDTILWDDEDELRSRGKSREDEAVGLASKNNLAKTIMEDFGSLPKKADLDDYAVVNVGPSVVPHPYLPTFRVFAYNITGTDDEIIAAGEKDEMNGMKRKHGHRNPKEKEVDCKKKEHRETWACRPKKPQYASPQAPSRMNRLWTPLGYAQVRSEIFSLVLFARV